MTPEKVKPKPCPECKGEMLPMLLSVDERTNRPGLFCSKCGHEEKVKPIACAYAYLPSDKLGYAHCLKCAEQDFRPGCYEPLKDGGKSMREASA